MKFKLFITKLLISFIFIQIIKTEKLHDDIAPWLIVGKNAYFIDTRSKFTSNEVNEICLKEDMIFTIRDSSLPDLIEAIHKTYGHNHTFWTYNNEINTDIIKNSLNGSGNCTKLATSDGQYHRADCSTRFALICEKLIERGILFYANGNSISINKEDVQKHCDPHSNKYDKTVQLCLIEFFDIESIP